MVRSTHSTEIVVTRLPWTGRFAGRSQRGILRIGSRSLTCAIGKGGMRAIKQEGDGSTPIGRFWIQHVFFRADRGRRPRTTFLVKAIRERDGWCDAPADRNYNRSVQHPYVASAERMWRSDHLYDVVVVIDHNQCPRIRGRGSAVFLHVTKGDFPPTEGCIALRHADLVWLLGHAGRRCRLTVRG